MEGRGHWVLGLGLLLGGVGCAHETMSLPPGAAPSSVQVVKEGTKPKRPPQPSTLVSYGNLYERTADEPGCVPATRDQLRDQARRSYQQALKTDPKNVPALLALARLYGTTGEQERAVATYRQALQLQAQDSAIWFEFGMYHARCKDWPHAIEAVTNAVNLDPENKQFAMNLGFCLARAGYFKQGFETFERLEGEASAHYNIGRMLLHVSQIDLGKEQLRLALQADPRLARAQELLAELEAPGTNPAQLPYPDPAPTYAPAPSSAVVPRAN